MKLTDNWFSTMAIADNELPIFISGREDLDEFRLSGKFKERVEIYWKYDSNHNGMPSDAEGELMEQVIDSLRNAVEKDKLAILTGIYTGNNERTLVFYTRTSRVFGERLNDALAEFPQLPITLYVEIDPEWNEQQELYQFYQQEQLDNL
ncbi:MAG: DUF695 domain-containing protein [Paludibacteraceae bacterium]|jgi:hypothetical protein|nr:DUF695 domain-containing protein [Paludibacteraceae bacterium]